MLDEAWFTCYRDVNLSNHMSLILGLIDQHFDSSFHNSVVENIEEITIATDIALNVEILFKTMLKSI